MYMNYINTLTFVSLLSTSTSLAERSASLTPNYQFGKPNSNQL